MTTPVPPSQPAPPSHDALERIRDRICEAEQRIAVLEAVVVRKDEHVQIVERLGAFSSRSTVYERAADATDREAGRQAQQERDKAEHKSDRAYALAIIAVLISVLAPFAAAMI